MITAISEADIQKASVNSISVGSVGIGPVTIGQLVITDLELNTAADGAFLRNFVVTVTYNMKLDWHLHIELPGNVIDDSGTEDLDSPQFIIGFGDIRLPGLENLKIDIANLAVDSPSATILPVTNIQLGKAVAEGIQAANLKLPTAPGLSDPGHRRSRRRLDRDTQAKGVPPGHGLPGPGPQGQPHGAGAH